MHILITGGAGFIGSHLADRLVDQGHYVTGLDNFATGSADNLAQLDGHPRFRLLRHCVTEPFPAETIGPLDRIYNLACPASPVHYQADPIHTTRTCVLGAINVLELARATGARILQASTSEVYGDPLSHPQPESYWGNVNPIGPRACYDEGKRCAETLFFDYRRVHGVAVKVARIFNTYGPRMHPEDGRIVSNFAVQALKREPLTLYGDGSQTRCFCYVDDMVEGLVRLMESPDALAGPVNLGNPVEYTVREVAEMTLELVGSDAGLVHRPLPADDPRRRKPVIALAREALGWAPTMPLPEGLKRTIDHFAAQLAHEAA